MISEVDIRDWKMYNEAFFTENLETLKEYPANSDEYTDAMAELFTYARELDKLFSRSTQVAALFKPKNNV